MPLLAAILVRCGTVPAHCWVTDWFEHASLGIALLFVVPLSGVYAAVRLVLPIGPELGIAEHRPACHSSRPSMPPAWRSSSAKRGGSSPTSSSVHSSLVLVGLDLHTESVADGLALPLVFRDPLAGRFRADAASLEARFGRLSLSDYHGLYEHTPTLAVCFLLTGLASVGFPGTLGFISTELLVDSAVEASPYVGIVVIAAGALNGIAVMRAYFLLFTGAAPRLDRIAGNQSA